MQCDFPSATSRTITRTRFDVFVNIKTSMAQFSSSVNNETKNFCNRGFAEGRGRYGGGMEKLSSKTDSVRLTESDSRWLQEWVKETKQDRAVVIRAAVKLLRVV